MDGVEVIEKLKQPIEWHVDLMDVHSSEGTSQDQLHKTVHVIRTSGGLESVPLADEYNYRRFMASEGAELLGIGTVIEIVGTVAFVAWRALSPVPEIDYTGWSR